MNGNINELVANASKLNARIGTNEKQEQEQDRKNKSLYNAVEAKVKKEKHSFITLRDRTLKRCENLLKNGADPSKLRLSEEDLCELSKKQKEYYSKFLKRLNNTVQKSRSIPQTVKIPVKKIISQITVQNEESYCSAIAKKQADSNVRKESYDSGIESHDTTPLIPRSVEKLKGGEETLSIEKKSSRIDKTRTKFKGFKKNIRKLVLKKKKEKNTILFSFENPNYEFDADDSVGNESGYESDCENDNKGSKSHLLLEAVEEKSLKKFKNLLNDGVDITAQDEKDNILHHIASLEKKQKCEFLDALIEKIPVKNLAQLINSSNNDGNTPLKKLLFTKVEKEKHESQGELIKIIKIIQKPFRKYDDNTIECAIKLLALGANVNDLELSESNVSQEEKEYYRNFLKKLKKSVEKSISDQKIKNPIIIKIAEIVEGGYPLHSAVRGGKKNKLNDLLQIGYDITTQDAEGNTALHYAIKLEKTIRYDFTALILEKNKELLNTKNNDGLTPIYILLEWIQKKNEDRSCTDRKLEETGRYQTLKLLLENGADISLKDDKKNNVLHHIASLKGKQKVTYLKLILQKIPEDKLSEAINATNKEGNTPLKLAVIKKAKKGLPLKNKTYIPKGFCNTTKFCVLLLQKGANEESLELEDQDVDGKPLKTDKYYLLLRSIKNHPATPPEAREKAKKLKEKLEKKYGCQTPLKKVKSDVKSAVENIGSGLRTAWKHIDPARRTCIVAVMAITITIITMTAVAFFEGKVAIEAAIPIIVIAGICLVLTLGFNIIKKFCKSLTTDKHSTSDEKNHFNSTAEQNQVRENTAGNNQQNLENVPNNQAVQEPSDQSEHAVAPNTKMNEPSIMRQFINSINRYLGFSPG